MKKIFYLILVFSLPVSTLIVHGQQNPDQFPFRNTSLAFDERVNDLVSRMTLQEKADQLLYTRTGNSPSWHSCLHMVERSTCMALQEQVMQQFSHNQLQLQTHGMKHFYSMWRLLSPMRQEQNIMSFREEARQVFTRDLLSGRQI